MSNETKTNTSPMLLPLKDPLYSIIHTSIERDPKFRNHTKAKMHNSNYQILIPQLHKM